MTFSRAGTLLVATLVATSTAQAQAEQVAIDPHWRAFLGCWASSAAGSVGPIVCLVPTASAERIEMISVANDSIVSRVPITTSGERTAVTRDGCTGWESGRWSADERRFFTRAEFRCDGGATQTASGIFAMSQSDAFTRIEGVKTKGATRVRAINFVWLDTVAVPRAIAARLPRFDALPAVGARIEAAATVSTADVVEATKQVDAEVVEAWLADRGQQFDVAAKDLRALRAAAVPTGVIDMVVAVSHPKVFAIAPNGQPGSRPVLDVRQTRSMDRTTREAVLAELRMMRVRNALSYGWGDFYFPSYGYTGMYGLGGFFSPFAGGYYGGLNNWYGGGFGGFGNGIFYGGAPYVIVPQSPRQPASEGRVVNGAGYTQSGGSSSGIARPTPSVSSGGYSGGSSSSGASSSGSTNGGGASAGSSGGRTAKPRP